MKIYKLKVKLIEGEKEKILINMPSEKIIFIQRKCEPPYHVSKKEKIIKSYLELIKNLENEELITYK